MNCPLCDTEKNITTRRYRLSDLIERWNSSFRFNPFPKDFPYKHIDKKRCLSCQLEYFDPPYHGDADFYAKISKYSWYYEENKWEYDVAADIVSRIEPESLLEIGCGNGFFLEKVEMLGSRIQGVDINNDAVAVCKAKGLKVDSVDVFEIKESYDMVVLFQVLEHMENLKELLEFLVAKVVRPGGHIIIAVPNPEGYLKEMGMNLLDMPPHHNSCWRLSTFEHMSSQYGLQLVEYKKEPLRYVHYLSLIQDMLLEHAKLDGTLKGKLFSRMQSLIIRLFAPLVYLRDRERIDGQTHLIVLKNAQ